ncbi:ABC-2 transporter permease [Oceanobacillus manasiensis]|uniref:ABC-2 transporter permease n=1 Tax=Oceanobacillus manasiensis TaxID=586413 RepID=UPI0005A65275|nr:ABC-2 transporter permease [Oceanobacillus manasiensis]
MITQLMKKDLYLNGVYYLVIVPLIPVFYVIELSDIYFFFAIILGFLFSLFYSDNLNNVNRFIGSLPVKLHHIVLSRYASLLLFVIGFLLYVWLVDSLAHYGSPYLASQQIDSISMTILFTTICIIVSISFPIYYYVESFNKAFFFQIIFLLFSSFTFAIFQGNELISFHEPFLKWLFDVIAFQPIVILIVISFVFLYLSYLLSAKIYTKKAKV